MDCYSPWGCNETDTTEATFTSLSRGPILERMRSGGSLVERDLRGLHGWDSPAQRG